MPDTTPTLSVANLVLRSKQQEIDALRHLAHKAEWVDVIGQLVQRLQRERGASCIYLASQTQRFAEVRHQAVNEALLHEEKLRQVFSEQMDPAQGTSAQTLSLMAWALLGLESLPALRLQIDRQAMSALDAVAAYSHLIAGLVELVFHMADTAGVPSVSRLLVALLHAVQATEEAGQERAVGALLYASGHCQEAHQQRLLHLIDAQERSLRVFADFAEPALRARWDELQLAPCMAQLERLRRALCVLAPAQRSTATSATPGSVPAPNAWTGCGSCKGLWSSACAKSATRASHMRSRTCRTLAICCAFCAKTRRSARTRWIVFLKQAARTLPRPNRQTTRRPALSPPRCGSCCARNRSAWHRWRPNSKPPAAP